MRLNCGNKWSAEIENAMKTLGVLVDAYLGSIAGAGRRGA
jgi:hypothetical protein